MVENFTGDGGDLDSIRDAVKQRVEQEKAVLPTEDEKPKTNFYSTQARIESGDRGNGDTFTYCNKDKLVSVDETGEWRYLDGHIWRLDYNDSFSLGRGVLAVVDEYLNYATHLDKQIVEAERVGNTKLQGKLSAQREVVRKAVKKLHSINGMRNCLAAARTQEDIRISESKLDWDPYALAFPNGFIDLKTGKFYKESRPDKYFTKCCNADFLGLDHRSELFEEIMLEIHDGSEEIVSFIQRYFGMALIGLVLERKFLILYGPGGQNGKGIYTGAISYALGDYAGPIPSEVLMASRIPPNSAGPSPHVMVFKRLRLAIASETEDGGKLNASKTKWYTGGDMLVGRHPHDRYLQSFEPSHSLVLLTNYKPRVSSDDSAFWARALLVPYKLTFVDRDPVSPNERRAIKDLAEQLKKEASGILSWLVRGCLDYQKQGLNPPQSILEETAEYKREEDFLADYIEQCLELDDLSQISAKDAYDNFRAWYEENISKKYVISNKKFGILFGRRFKKKKTPKKNVYLGVKLKDL